MSASIGIVEPKKVILSDSLTLDCGKELKEIEMVYESYGSLNENSSNAVLICHALSGNHHAAGFYAGDKRGGWWDSLIGPGKAIDTNKFFVVCPNNIGGCHGSIGPA